MWMNGEPFNCHEGIPMSERHNNIQSAAQQGVGHLIPNIGAGIQAMGYGPPEKPPTRTPDVNIFHERLMGSIVSLQSLVDTLQDGLNSVLHPRAEVGNGNKVLAGSINPIYNGPPLAGAILSCAERVEAMQQQVRLVIDHLAIK